MNTELIRQNQGKFLKKHLPFLFILSKKTNGRGVIIITIQDGSKEILDYSIGFIQLENSKDIFNPEEIKQIEEYNPKTEIVISFMDIVNNRVDIYRIKGELKSI